MTFDVAHLDAPPALASPPQGANDQLQTTFLGEEPWDGSGPAAFFQKAAFQEVGGADGLVMDALENPVELCFPATPMLYCSRDSIAVREQIRAR